MPLTKRAVSPVNLSRNTIPPSINRDELQCTANGTIANLIRQLSSLSKLAENIFGEIYHDAMVIHHKASTLQQRIDRLHSKVDQLDSSTDQASLNEANMRKAFKSSMLVDQHILDRSTLPVSLAERYAKCDPPPDLDALNPYRDSPIPALSLYTNPSFFFDLWKKETLKEVADRPRRVKSPNDGSKSPKKRRKQPQQGQGPLGTTVYNDVQHRNRQISGTRLNQQNEVFSFPEEYQAPQALGLQLNFKNQNQHPSNHGMVPPLGMTMHHHPQQNVSSTQQRGPQSAALNNRGSPIIKRPTEPPPSAIVPSLEHLPPPDMSILLIDDDDDELPPPPPPLLMHTSIVHQLPSEVLPSTIQFVEPSAAPPTNIPPPPPPPPLMPISSAAATFAAPASKSAVIGESSTSSPAQSKQTDARTDLLAQIQSGIKLKKVQRAEAEAAEKAALEANNVAAILKRRMDQVMGNDDSSSEEGADDDEWDD